MTDCCDFGHTVMSPDGTPWVFCRKHLSYAFVGDSRCKPIQRKTGDDRTIKQMAAQTKEWTQALGKLSLAAFMLTLALFVFWWSFA